MRTIIVNDNTPQFLIWLGTCQSKFNEHNSKNYPDMPENAKDELVAKVGERYIKIVRQSLIRETAGSRTGMPCRSAAWAFIDRTNGDVLKPAGWNAPAKGSRGNIFHDDNGMGSMGPYGPGYLRHGNVSW